jgi:DNA replication and repair protein RecF
MPVGRLTLAGFRSYALLETTLEEGPNVVVGPNAAGKTNLVEAITLLSTGRSHRSSSDTEMVRWGSPFARAWASVTPGSAAGVTPAAGAATSRSSWGGPQELEVVIHASNPDGGPRKRVRVNGVSRRPGSLAQVLRSVLFAPEDMLLITGSPTLRRSVLDTLIVQREPTAAATLAGYSRVLTQRNSLLRRIREGAASPAELPAWDAFLCEQGGRIVTWRHEALAALAGPLAEAHAEIAPAESGEGGLTLRYVSNAAPGPGEDPGAAIRRRLAETAEKEIWNGATLVGPHRDDLVFQSGGRDLATFASRGQQRTAILALKLAELDTLTRLDGRPPLLLLDDVFSELDPERRAHLVRRIAGLPQAIVTTTATEDLDASLVSAASLWRVEPGSLRRITPTGAAPAA